MKKFYKHMVDGPSCSEGLPTRAPERLTVGHCRQRDHREAEEEDEA